MTKISSKNTKFPLIFPHKIYKNPSQFIQKWTHGLLLKYTKKSPNITKKTSKMPQGDFFLQFWEYYYIKRGPFCIFWGLVCVCFGGKTRGAVFVLFGEIFCIF
jgi:hypothetical protein